MNSSTDRLAALISAKLQLVELLARLGRRQLELIEAGQMNDLVKLLAAKLMIELVAARSTQGRGTFDQRQVITADRQ